MGIPLRVLIIEDVEDDAELLVQELRSKGYDPLYERVDTEKAMLEALDRQTWDIIICDYSMPGFNAISAMELKRKIQNDLPLILISGTIGEEVAVEAMKAGAADYIMKDNLSRFVPAIERELAEYKERCRVRKVEGQLRKLYRAIEHSPSVVVVTDIEGKIEFVNPKFSDITGYSAEEAVGKNPRILNSGNQAQEFYKELWDTITSGKEWHGEFCNKKKNGELYWESASISSVKDDKGVITNYVAVKEDITERRQMEEAIQTLVKGTVGVTGQEFFDRIVTSICAWFGTDYAFVGNIVDGKTSMALSMQVNGEIISDYVYDLKGTPCGNVVENSYCVYPEGVSGLFPNDKDLIDMKVEGYVGITLKDKNNRVIGILWTASRRRINLPLRNAEVMEIIAAKASAEIERMRAEEELQKSEQLHRKLLNTLREGVYKCESHVDGVFTWVNQACAEIFGYKTPEEMIGTKVENIYLDPEDRGRLIETLEKDGVSRNFESFCKKKNGEQIYTERTSNMIRDEEGKPDCIEGVIRDITERKKMEESLKKSEEAIKTSLREKEVLLKEVHHRVKNNMQIISSLLNMQSETIKDENILKIFKESQNRVKSMALIHEKLYQTKDLSKIDFGEYTRSLTARLLHSFGDNTTGVQLMIDIDEVYLDVNKAIPCGLIINEIITNSIKHAFPDCTTGVDKNKFKGKGVIKISMRNISDSGLQNTASKSAIRNPQSEIIELVISDNGIGLPEGLDFRNTKTLGMELVNTLVGQLKGTIEYVKDKGGTEFKITFGR